MGGAPVFNAFLRQRAPLGLFKKLRRPGAPPHGANDFNIWTRAKRRRRVVAEREGRSGAETQKVL